MRPKSPQRVEADVGRRLDALIMRTVPGVHKAVKFFRSASLHPLPPGESKQKEVRYLDIREDDQVDEAQLADWVKQASQLPGEKM